MNEGRPRDYLYHCTIIADRHVSILAVFLELADVDPAAPKAQFSYVNGCGHSWASL